MENKAHYKWRKLFAAKRFQTKDGVIKLTPLEQQELLDDINALVENNCVLDDVSNCPNCKSNCVAKGFNNYYKCKNCGSSFKHSVDY